MRSPPGLRSTVLISVLLAIAGACGFRLATSREASHLALWRLQESGSRAEIDAPPPGLPPPRADVPADGDLGRAIALAAALQARCDHPSGGTVARWGSEARMLRQIDAGAVADCWPRSVLLAAAALREGFKARIWALEGDRFDGNPHTVAEIYLPDRRRWVMFDVTTDVRAADERGEPLGFLDVRDRVLGGGAGPPGFLAIRGAARRDSARLARFYAARGRYAFLRGGPGLVPGARYGVLAPLAGVLDRLPEPAMKAAAALLGETGRVRYYRDAHNAPLASAARLAKAWALGGLLALAGAVLVGLRGAGAPTRAVRTTRRRVALALAALPVVLYGGFAGVYFVYSRPPSGTWRFRDGFEAGDLRAFTAPGMRQTCCPHSARVVGAPVREGGHALRMRLEAGDPLVRGSHRAEMRFPPTRPGSSNEYAFSVYVPRDWPSDPLPTSVAQWHAVPDRWRGEAPVPSPLHLLIDEGRWTLQLAWDDRPVTRPLLGSGLPRGIETPLALAVEPDRWVDWTFRVRWAHDATGSLVVLKDGREVLRRAGPIGYDDAAGPYFKFGIYRIPLDGGPAKGTRTLYFDAIVLRQGAP